jgi:hypothetical protein
MTGPASQPKVGDVVIARDPGKLCFRVAAIRRIRGEERWLALRAPWGVWYHGFWFRLAPPDARPVRTLEELRRRRRKK